MVNFKPDFVWDKSQEALHETMCLLTLFVELIELNSYSNSTSAEVNNATELTAFNNNGFSYGTS
jgi:hypothetical protein